MNTAVIRLTNCKDCQYCEYNGMFQTRPKYICANKKVYGRNKVNAKYWYDQPILASVNSKTGKQIDIPDWCPYKDIKRYRMDLRAFSKHKDRLRDSFEDSNYDRNFEEWVELPDNNYLICDKCKKEVQEYWHRHIAYIKKEGEPVIPPNWTETCLCKGCYNEIFIG